MFLGTAVTFTNPTYNNDSTYSLTPPDSGLTYTTNIPHVGNVFIYSTVDGKRYEISKLQLIKFGFNIDSGGNTILSLPPPVESAGLFYIIYEHPDITRAGYNFINFHGDLITAGFVVSNILYDKDSKASISITYTTQAQLTNIQQAEQDYIHWADGNPSLLTNNPIITINPNNTDNTFQSFMDMKIAGISAPLVAGGVLAIIFLLRR